MATVEELLAVAETIPDAEVKNKVIRIDSNLRTMSIPAEFGPLGVESDDDVNKVQFEIPRYYGEIDLSTFEIRINYMNANGDGDIYDVTDLNIVDDSLVFSWLVGRLALAYKGAVKFIVCFKRLNEDFTVDKEFNTTLASLPVLEGLEPSKHLVDVYPDIIERMLKYMEAPISSEQIHAAVESYLKNNPIISEHNLSEEAHKDIRQLILGLTNRLNTLADSDDTTLDQLSELVAYIKNNKGLIDAITTGKVSTSDIVDNLVTNVGTKVLSAAQGVVLKTMIDGAVSTLSEQVADKVGKDQLKEIHMTPQMYGAVGDGVTDDTPAFKAMFESAKDGDSIYIPVGTYKLTEPLTINKVLYISGEAAFIPFVWDANKGYCGSTIKTSANAFIIARSGVTIQNITIVSEVMHGNAAILINPDTITDGVTFCLAFENVYFYQFAYGIRATCQCFKSRFNNVYAQECANGFVFAYGGTSLTLTNCWVMWATELAYYFYKYQYCTLNNCACDNSKNGTKLEECSGFNLIGCGCEFSEDYSFFVTNCDSVTVQGCFAYKCKTSNAMSDQGALFTAYDSNNIIVFGCEDREGTEGTDSIVDIRNTNSAFFNNTIRTLAVNGVKNGGYVLNLTPVN